jgi:hypothetical protein
MTKRDHALTSLVVQGTEASVVVERVGSLLVRETEASDHGRRDDSPLGPGVYDSSCRFDVLFPQLWVQDPTLMSLYWFARARRSG